MKRDLELIKAILLLVENHNSILHLHRHDMKIENKNEEDISYNIKLLADAGYLEAKFSKPDSKGNYRLLFIERMTWEGQEFLASLKNKKLWNRLVNHFKEEGKDVTTIPLYIIKEVTKQLGVASLKEVFGIK